MKTPKTFQNESIEKFRDHTGLLIADDCGLGKTLTGTEAIKAVCSSSASHTLLLCPPSVIPQWKETVAEQWESNANLVESHYVPYHFVNMKGHVWVFMSYYELYKDYMRDAVNEMLWDYIVVDEAHRFRNRKSKLFEYVLQIPKVRSLSLTATPMEQGQHDLWSYLSFHYPHKFTSYWRFVKKHFIVEEGWFTKWEIKGPQDPTAFAEFMDPYMIQHHKSDVMPELPERIDIPTTVAMDDAQADLYSKLKESTDIIVNIQDQRILLKNALAVLTKLQQVSSFPQLLGLKARSGKLDWLHEFLEDHRNDRVVMFTRFRPLADYLKNTYDAALIAGGVNEVTKFKSKHSIHAVCVIANSLQGVDGLQDAQHAIFIDGHWSATQMTQALDRIHRMDITEPKNVYLLSSTVEDRLVYKASEKKWNEQELLYYLLKEFRR